MGLAAAGCGPSEGRFAERLYEASCARAFACYGEDAAGYWEDEQACAEAYADEAEALHAYYRDCEYVKVEAEACLEAFEALECGASVESLDACDRVWEC